MRVLLAGLMTRRGMNATSLLVTVIAIVAAVLGPMYGRETAEHLLDTRLDERAPYTTGLSYSVASANGVVPDSLAALEADQAPAVDDLLPDARQPFQEPEVTRYWSSPRSWALDVTGTFTRGPQKYAAPTYWRQGMCDLARITGRCPQSAGEALMQATMAKTLGLAAGDTFDVTYLDIYFGPIKDGTKVEKQRRRVTTYRLVGTYVIDDPASPDWFDLSRFTGLDDLVVPPQRGTGAAPSAPALLVAPSSMVSQAFRVGVDRPIDTTAIDLDTLDRVEGVAERFKTRAIDASAGGQTEVLPDLDLGSVIDQVRSERTLLSRVMIAATVPLVLLTLLLLFALVSTAAQVRRPHVALAKLRGQSRAQVLRFALSEPFLVVLVAVPVGVGVAVGAAHVIARGWLHPGIPVGLDVVAILSLVAVVASALVASTVAALTVIREPLSAALAGSVRRATSGRVSLVLRSAVVAVALASVGNLVTSGDQSRQLLALLTPTFVALAVAVAGALLLRGIGRVWTRRTASSGGTPAYLAARRLSRRDDVANLMIPLLLAAAVLTFAAATTATSDSWRVARRRPRSAPPGPTSPRRRRGGCSRSPARSTPTGSTSPPRPPTPSGTTWPAASSSTPAGWPASSPGTRPGPTVRSPCSRRRSRSTTTGGSPSPAGACSSTSATWRCGPAPGSGPPCGSSTSTTAASRRTSRSASSATDRGRCSRCGSRAARRLACSSSSTSRAAACRSATSRAG